MILQEVQKLQEYYKKILEQQKLAHPNLRLNLMIPVRIKKT